MCPWRQPRHGRGAGVVHPEHRPRRLHHGWRAGRLRSRSAPRTRCTAEAG